MTTVTAQALRKLRQVMGRNT